jgi:CheY-like chemotaxis protein
MAKLVLIIEDDEDTQRIYATALTERGYRVVVADHGAEGVHLARTLVPDLILLDIRMPVMSGWGALEYLSAYEETRTIPICAISAYQPEVEELQRVEEAEQFRCFLLKPVEPWAITEKVHELIGPPDHNPQPQGTH